MSKPTPSPEWQPKAILFDLLTALTDSWSLWNVAAGSPSLGLRWRRAYLEVTYGCGAYRPYEELVLQAAVQAGLEGPGRKVTRLREVWGDLAPWPETVAVLTKLKAKGHQLGVVTNCSVELGRQAAVFFPFDLVLTAEEAGWYKPHPRPYELALEKLGLGETPGEALFVAGSASDVPGAGALGMRVVWHNRVGLERKGDVEGVREGRTLEEVLSEWL